MCLLKVLRSASFDRWLDGLRRRNRKAALVIARRLERVRSGNLGDVKPLGGGLSEMRIAYGPGYRAYYIQEGDEVIVLLCGGDKDSQRRDIEQAREIAKAWEERT